MCLYKFVCVLFVGALVALPGSVLGSYGLPASYKTGRLELAGNTNTPKSSEVNGTSKVVNESLEQEETTTYYEELKNTRIVGTSEVNPEGVYVNWEQLENTTSHKFSEASGNKSAFVINLDLLNGTISNSEPTKSSKENPFEGKYNIAEELTYPSIMDANESLKQPRFTTAHNNSGANGTLSLFELSTNTNPTEVHTEITTTSEPSRYSDYYDYDITEHLEQPSSNEESPKMRPDEINENLGYPRIGERISEVKHSIDGYTNIPGPSNSKYKSEDLTYPRIVDTNLKVNSDDKNGTTTTNKKAEVIGDITTTSKPSIYSEEALLDSGPPLKDPDETNEDLIYPRIMERIAEVKRNPSDWRRSDMRNTPMSGGANRRVSLPKFQLHWVKTNETLVQAGTTTTPEPSYSHEEGMDQYNSAEMDYQSEDYQYGNATSADVSVRQRDTPVKVYFVVIVLTFSMGLFYYLMKLIKDEAQFPDYTVNRYYGWV